MVNLKIKSVANAASATQTSSMRSVDENPYQSPMTEPPPRASWRELASFGVKILSVPIGLIACCFGAEAGVSVLILAFPRSQEWILGPALGIGIASGIAAAAYCFRIANAIHPKTVPNQDSN
jgi:hypothetical protein